MTYKGALKGDPEDAIYLKTHAKNLKYSGKTDTFIQGY
jgi:hypothetical protein